MIVSRWMRDFYSDMSMGEAHGAGDLVMGHHRRLPDIFLYTGSTRPVPLILPV
jgi:hypothetical protein